MPGAKPKQVKTEHLDHSDGEKAAFGEEIHLFLHCHLRGYDAIGKGKSMDAAYYDKYGAPVHARDTWTEGYFTVEKNLADHFNKCLNSNVGFPLVAGYGGGSHLYKPLHNDTPWNWTGWIPLQASWISRGNNRMFFHKNRFFMGLRGNEIQNNLWDYHPHDEEEVADEHEWIYDQISPVDAYRGGYWYTSLDERSWARYLHIMALKSHHDVAKRYNFIVHPLAYRASLNLLPDASVDGIQWSVANTPFEEHFVGANKKWGDCVHAIELFNDFTYFYSWLPSAGYKTNNGRLNSDGTHIVWFETYPLEYCEFLIESSLARGAYLQILSANDAFYNRDSLPPSKSGIAGADLQTMQNNYSILMSDPKGKLVKKQEVNTSLKHIPHKKSIIRAQNYHKTTEQMAAEQFLSTRPYEEDTVFGYTTLIDTNREIKAKVFPTNQPWAENLEAGEEMMIDYLIDGSFFSHTGIYDLFNYSSKSQAIPFIIEGQPDVSKLCYEITSNMQLKFTFPPFKHRHGNHRIWRYTIEQKLGENRETVNGYFKLSHTLQTVLDLSTRYQLANIKWIRFTIFDCKNSMKRAWFSPIKGPAFGVPIKAVELPTLTHRIAKTNAVTNQKLVITESEEVFTPTSVENNATTNLTFNFQKLDKDEEEDYLYAYFAFGNSLQADIFTKADSKVDPDVYEATKESYKNQPPRYLQNIQGYFPLSAEFPTRIELKNSWDTSTIQNVYFYGIEPTTCQPIPIPTQ